MFISPAYAQTGGGAGGGIEALLPLVLIFVVFYFLLIRPQQKKMKEHKAMLNDIKRGDEVVTGGGIMGKVTKVNDDHVVTVELAEGVKVRVRRELISAVLNKTAPTAANDSGAQKSGGLLSGLFGGGSKPAQAAAAEEPVEEKPEEAPKKPARKPRARKKPAASKSAADKGDDSAPSAGATKPANDDT